MKKILLIIAITFLIFQMVVLATEITVGNAATDRSGYYNQGTTYVDRINAADGTGKITSVKIYSRLVTMTGAKVAIFYVVDGNNLTARDSEIVQIAGQDPGVVPYGSEQTAITDLDVVIGDYIGLYWAYGQLEVDAFGVGEWHLAGDQTGCVDATFTAIDDRTLSLGGIGETEEEEEVNVIFFGTSF